MRCFRLIMIGLVGLRTSASFAGMSYQCTSHPQWARISEVFTVSEEQQIATLVVEGQKPIENVLVHESADVNSSILGTVDASLPSQFVGSLLQTLRATTVGIDITQFMHGMPLQGRKFVFEIARPVGRYQTFAARAAIYEQFADGRRIAAEYLGVDGFSRVLFNVLNCKALQ